MAARYARRDWEDFEIEVLIALYPIWTGEQLSRLFQRSRSCIHQKAARLGLKACSAPASDGPQPVIETRPQPDQPEAIEAIATQHGIKTTYRTNAGATVTRHIME